MRRTFRFGFAVAVPVVVFALGFLFSSPKGMQNAYAASYVSVGDGGWECVRPTPSRQQWVDAHFIDDKTGWILGLNFDIMKTTDGGKNWAPQGHRIEKVAYDICFTDKDHGWVVGGAYMSANDQSGIILKTDNGGATWRKVLDGKTDGLRSVCFVNNNVGWAVGGLPSKVGVILKTTDGGETWFKQDCGDPVKEGGTRIFEDVWFLDENTGWVVGGKRAVYKTTDGGKTWTLTTLPGKGWLRGVQFVDANTGWVLSQTMLRTTDGGTTWTEYALGKTPSTYDFHFSDAQNGVVVSAGEILRSLDGGRTWISNAETKVGGFSASAYMTDAKNGWLVWDYAFGQTSDGGKTWQVKSGGDGDVALGVNFVNPKLGWATGYTWKETDYACLVLKTADGGETWNRQVLPIKGKLNETFFLDEKLGWSAASDGKVVVTKDGGATWTEHDTGTKSYLMAGLQFLDANIGYAAGMQGTVIKTTDGGETWTRLDLGTMDGLWGISFVDESIGWVTGENGRIMKTTDGGQTWKRQVSGLTTCLGGLCFANEKVGWASDNKGTVTSTTDGGQTWVRQKSGVDQQLAMIRFIDDQEGWAASKPIIHTSDGGQTWTVQDHGTELLWDICFADKEHGWAASAGGILRTTTGGLPGAVWAKKQADGAPANFGHLVVTKKSDGFLLAEHPDSRVGIHIKTSDTKPNVGDYIYVHGKVATENAEKIIAADSIDIMCAGWGVLPEK